MSNYFKRTIRHITKKVPLVIFSSKIGSYLHLPIWNLVESEKVTVKKKKSKGMIFWREIFLVILDEEIQAPSWKPLI